MARPIASPCPCQSGHAYARCCGPLLDGQTQAPSAEALMRSRYSAYTLGLSAYLLATWHPSTRPATLTLDEEPRPKWIGLQVHHHLVDDDEHARVEFTARYRIGGRAQRLHEISRFVRESGQWYYVDGEVDDGVAKA